MEKLAENDLTYFYLRHVVIVVTAVTTISLPPVNIVESGIKHHNPNPQQMYKLYSRIRP
jgi:hypothetical protein